MKEVASSQSAEMIVTNREQIKIETLAAIRDKVGEAPGGGPLVAIQDHLGGIQEDRQARKHVSDWDLARYFEII